MIMAGGMNVGDEFLGASGEERESDSGSVVDGFSLST